jgi:hypothetical protein
MWLVLSLQWETNADNSCPQQDLSLTGTKALHGGCSCTPTRAPPLLQSHTSLGFLSRDRDDFRSRGQAPAAPVRG